MSKDRGRELAAIAIGAFVLAVAWRVLCERRPSLRIIAGSKVPAASQQPKPQLRVIQGGKA